MIKIIIMLLAVCMVIGCLGMQIKNANVRPGMSLDELTQALGPPEGIEQMSPMVNQVWIWYSGWEQFRVVVNTKKNEVETFRWDSYGSRPATGVGVILPPTVFQPTK